MNLAANIAVPLIEEGVDRRLIAFSEPWFPAEECTPMRYEAVIGGLPAVVELAVPAHGLQGVTYVVSPARPEAPFDLSSLNAEWPGDVWGTAIIDRRLKFCVLPVRFHCRIGERSFVKALPCRDFDELRMPIGLAA